MPRSTRHPNRPRRVRRPVDPPSPALAAELEAMAHTIDEASEWGCSPALLYLAPSVEPDQPPERGLVDLSGESVPSRLCGWRAPAHWHALGSYSAGNAFHTDHTGVRRTGAAGRARVIHIVHRSGLSVSLLRREDDDEPTVMSETPAGRIDDYTRRALGIPSQPVATSTLELFALQWLVAILDEVPTSWSATAALHPAARVGSNEQLRGEGLAPDGALVPLGMSLARAATWGHLRTECAKGRLHLPEMPAELARWHDDGSFSRELLGEWPPLSELIEAAIDVLPIAAAVELTDTLAAWELWGEAA